MEPSNGNQNNEYQQIAPNETSYIAFTFNSENINNKNRMLWKANIRVKEKGPLSIYRKTIDEIRTKKRQNNF